jgi:hypothetical protein
MDTGVWVHIPQATYWLHIALELIQLQTVCRATQCQYMQLITDGNHALMELISCAVSRTKEHHGICIVHKQSDQEYCNCNT